VTTPTKATEQHQQRQVGRNARLYGNAVMEISRGFVGGQPNKGNKPGGGNLSRFVIASDSAAIS